MMLLTAVGGGGGGGGIVVIGGGRRGRMMVRGTDSFARRRCGGRGLHDHLVLGNPLRAVAVAVHHARMVGSKVALGETSHAIGYGPRLRPWAPEAV